MGHNEGAGDWARTPKPSGTFLRSDPLGPHFGGRRDFGITVTFADDFFKLNQKNGRDNGAGTESEETFPDQSLEVGRREEPDVGED